MKYCYWFKELNHSNLSIAGGKGANLGELTQIGMPVPNGFVISSNAYFKFLDKSSLKNKIKSELEHLDTSNSEKLQAASENVKTSILAANIPNEIADEILVFYKELSGIHNRKVAVRSSATAK
jgi:pyruvate, water dikinase